MYLMFILFLEFYIRAITMKWGVHFHNYLTNPKVYILDKSTTL